MNPQITESVWALNEHQLTQLSELVSRLIDLRRSYCCPLSEQPPAPPPAPAAPESPLPALSPGGLREPNLPARRPLRRPRPGSLRGDVHTVLKQAAEPLSRSEISIRVAGLRGAECTEALTNKVGGVLSCRHDSAIKRLRHGIYRYAQ